MKLLIPLSIVLALAAPSLGSTLRGNHRNLAEFIYKELPGVCRKNSDGTGGVSASIISAIVSQNSNLMSHRFHLLTHREVMVKSMTCTREKTIRPSITIGARTSATIRAPVPALNTVALVRRLNAKSG